jgi:hypothetical protein
VQKDIKSKSVLTKQQTFYTGLKRTLLFVILNSYKKRNLNRFRYFVSISQLNRPESGKAIFVSTPSVEIGIYELTKKVLPEGVLGGDRKAP